jgi:hypothetical protein
MVDLAQIVTNGGAKFTVARDHAPRFQALLNDLEERGYPIKGDQSGGYNPRNIAGTSTPSRHAFGNAVDVNWSDNPRDAAGSLPPDLARELAAKHGMTWGGDWRNPDPMHFEVGGAPATQPSPVQGQQPGPLPTPQATPETQPSAGFAGLPEDILAAIARNVGLAPQQQAQMQPKDDAGVSFGSLSGQSDDKKMTREEYDQEAADAQAQRAPALPTAQRHRVNLSKLRSVLGRA